MARRVLERLLSRICVEPQPQGLRAVYLVETQDEHEADEVAAIFQDLAPTLQSVQLTKGKLVAYAVQLLGEDQSLFKQLESHLQQNFGLVMIHSSFDAIIYDMVRELSKDTGSTLLPISKCNICGKLEPFPQTVTTFLDKDGITLATRVYCGTCTAESAGRNSKEFLMALLDADINEFGMLRNLDIVRSRSSKKRLAFRINP